MHCIFDSYFLQDELRKFIKFACNQERIPFGLPCREGGKDTETHVPPYPMKIAPPDGKGREGGRDTLCVCIMIIPSIQGLRMTDMSEQRLVCS